MNDLPEDVSAVISKNNYTSSDRIGSIVLNGFSELPPGDYDFSVEAVYGLQREVFHLNLKNRGSIQSPPKILSPIDKAGGTVQPKNLSFVQATRSIYKSEGMLGFMRGLSPSLIKAFLTSGSYFSTLFFFE